MRATYLVHILGGTLSLLAGYLALYTAKGGRLHRQAGIVFVYAMLAMCVAGATIAVTRKVAMAMNVPAALLTSYLVITALTAVRAPAWNARWLQISLMLVALGVGFASLSFAYEAISSPNGRRNGMPAFPFVMFGVVGTLAGALDLRMLRAGGLRGAARIGRHLWRMSFALLIAALSFFLGQARVIPKPIRIPALLALPVLAVFVTMLYWIWRVSVRRRLRGLIGIDTSATPPLQPRA